ncbi:hypothetical protein P9112_010321 [Eukaryota sp. TZLM1-RC]
MSLLECGICLKTMEEPTTLTCGHSFCRTKCLSKWLKSNSTCPSCRKNVSQQTLSINIALIEAIDALNQKPKESPVCNDCLQADATLFCEQCDGVLCQECSSQLHEHRLLKNHNIVPLEKKASLASVKCPRHKTKNLEYFCTQCKVAICDSCGLLEGHAAHNQQLIPLLDAKEAVTEEVKTLQEALSTCTLSLPEPTERVDQVVKETLSTGQSILNDLIADLIRQSATLINQIDCGEVFDENLLIDGQLKEKGIECVGNAIDILQEYQNIWLESFQNIENFTKNFKLTLFRKLLNQDFVDVSSFNISKRAQEVLMAVQFDSICTINREIIGEILSCEIPNDLKSKTISLFFAQSRVIKSIDFIWLLQFSEFLNIAEIKSITNKIDFGDLGQEEFTNILNFGISHSLTDLIVKVIDNYQFQSLPEVVEIPVDFLSNLTLSNVVDGNKEVWLEKVVNVSCNQGNIREVSKRLLGREVCFKRLNVGVYCSTGDNYLDDIVSMLRKGFNQNWNHVEISISPGREVNNFNELSAFDVVVVETYSMRWTASFLNQILESGKGLVLFNAQPANGFNYSCFDGGQFNFYQQSRENYVTMTPTLPDDPLLKNVSSFSSNAGRISANFTSGTVVATINNGTPLIAKKIVASGRLVEFGFFSLSSDIHAHAGNWHASSDGHLLIANAVAWCGECV